MIDRRRSLLTVALALLAGAGAACGSDLQTDETGTYVLRTIGDSTVPFAQYSSPGYTSVLLADTLTLDGRGGLASTSVTRDSRPGAADTTVRYMGTGRYARRGDLLYYSFTCPPNALCAYIPTAYRLVAGGLRTVVIDRRYPSPTSVFERIR